MINSEVNQLKAFLGDTGPIATVYSQQSSLPRAAGISSDIASAFLTFDGFTAVFTVIITTETGLCAEHINIAVTAAPTKEFSNEILNTFLPIDYELLYTGIGELDSDGDGVPESQDAAPFDPTRH